VKVADYKSDNELISLSNTFTSEPIFLDRHHIMQNTVSIGTIGSVTYYHSTYAEIIGDYFGSEPYRYVGFKVLEGNDTERLGWLKLKITNHDQLEIFQMGLQDPI